ncbi:MAG TPA: response regulator transcription factor [Herpetosiphonaceae bacterium]|nr:response regulator transcription factor [Herpetosiphonaceae bacterium]
MIRVLLVDDHASFRQALAFMMDREPDITITAQAGSLAEGGRVLDGVDVAVVDLELPDGNGTELVQELRAANPESLVLILTAADDALQLARAVEAGASGVLHKSAGISEIITAVRRLNQGEQLLSRREVIEMLHLLGEQREQNREAQAALARLTKREQEVLQALADGLNDKDIAERLNISGETARSHMVKILSKLGVNSRLQALVFAIRHGAVKIT